jgi:DNA modification methylase
VAIDRLKPYERQARTHDEDQLAMLAGSLEAFGFIDPIIVDGTYRVLAGHGRWEAAKRLGYKKVPVVGIDHLSEDEIRAYVIASNALAERAGWDKSVLAIEFQHLSQIDLGFELDVTGFTIGEIDIVIGQADQEETAADPADEVPAVAGKAVSRSGDLWLLGRHRLICGNALSAGTYDLLMQGKQARMVLSDPPFNLVVDGFVSGLGKNRHREFRMGSGEMSESDFIAFLTAALENMKTNLLEGGLAYVFMDHRHLFELISAARATNLSHVNLCVWNKTNNPGMGSFYRSQHELCLVLKNGTGRFLNNVELGRHGRNRSNVWSHPGLASFGRGRDEALASHPTVKPVVLLAEAMKDTSKRGDIILDPFCGSGSTLIAAEKTGRVGYGIELDPLYADTIVRRWEKVTGKTAVHAETDLPFSTISAQREAEQGKADAAGMILRQPADPAVKVRHRARPLTMGASHV